jgi:hypothetical protein
MEDDICSQGLDGVTDGLFDGLPNTQVANSFAGVKKDFSLHLMPIGGGRALG